MPRAQAPTPRRLDASANWTLSEIVLTLSKNTWCHCPPDWYDVHAVCVAAFQYVVPDAMAWAYVTACDEPVAASPRSGPLVGSSYPKSGRPRMTFEAPAAATY